MIAKTYLVFNPDGSLDATYTGLESNVHALPNQKVILLDADQKFDINKFYYLGAYDDVVVTERVPGFKFNYESKEWYDPTGLHEYKLRKWEEIKAQRDLHEFGGFNWNGYIFDSDSTSQARILGAFIAATPIVWTLSNNIAINLSPQDMSAVYTALQQHVAAIHERGRIARQKINNATSTLELEGITL